PGDAAHHLHPLHHGGHVPERDHVLDLEGGERLGDLVEPLPVPLERGERLVRLRQDRRGLLQQVAGAVDVERDDAHRLADRHDGVAGLPGDPLGGAVPGAGLVGGDAGIGHQVHGGPHDAVVAGAQHDRAVHLRQLAQPGRGELHVELEPAGAEPFHGVVVAEHDEGAGLPAQDALQAVAQRGARGHRRERGPPPFVQPPAVHRHSTSHRGQPSSATSAFSARHAHAGRHVTGEVSTVSPPGGVPAGPVPGPRAGTRGARPGGGYGVPGPATGGAARGQLTWARASQTFSASTTSNPGWKVIVRALPPRAGTSWRLSRSAAGSGGAVVSSAPAGTRARVNPSRAASASRRRTSRTGRSSPARPTSPSATSPAGSGLSPAALATASSSARSTAGSTSRMPPTVAVNTSQPPSRAPSRRSSTASTIATRYGSSPEEVRRGCGASVGPTSACTSAGSGRVPSTVTVTQVPGTGSDRR